MSSRLNTPITLCRIQRPGYVHTGAFDEVVDMLAHGLQSLGCPLRQTHNDIGGDGITLIIGAHLLSDTDLARLPASAVIYNFEQIGPDSLWLKPGYLAALGRCEVWDYSERNVERIRELTGNPRIHFVPVGYAEPLSRIAPARVQDIDVLFYGSVNERRARVLEQLRAMGLTVEAVFGVFGAERDALIARAKVVLNLHFYQTSIFEVVRVFYLMANRKAVVAECHDQSEIYPDLRAGVCLSDYDGLAAACQALVHDDALRAHYEQQGYACISARPVSEILRQCLSAPVEPLPAPQPLPGQLNLGSGGDFRADCLNLDLQPRHRPDLVLDIAKPLAAGAEYSTARFGRVRLEAGGFTRIIANDVLQQVDDLVCAMGNCLQLLCDGGELAIRVPYDLSCAAWADPANRRAFNEQSWHGYSEGHRQLGWHQARFDLVTMNVVLGARGKQLRAQGEVTEALLSVPRAVEALEVILRKRVLTTVEGAAPASAPQEGKA